ncbi:MAG TPA: alpha/beta fold hydrolase [Ilumatobacteraceae bacterium]|nr:alpha/beta fold hydrolase [Ilumatobacteraceae bacterium]
MSDWHRLDGELAAWSLGTGPRLVFVHGFTQTSTSWRPIAAALAEDGYESVVVDAPGHGDSAPVHVDLRRAAELLTAMCGPAVYIGYSMGGRLCLHAAVFDPRSVVALVLISASPGIADDLERATRRDADARLADHLGEVGVETFLDEWLTQALFAGLASDVAQRADRLRNSAEGLASSLRLAGAGAQESLWPRLAELAMPVLAVAGAADSKYAAIARRIADTVRHGRCEVIEGAGHAAHLQAADRVLAAVRGWLRTLH